MLRYGRVKTEDYDSVESFIESNLELFGEFHLSSSIAQTRVVKHVSRQVLKQLQEGAGFCLRSKSALKALGTISRSEWDSKILDKNVGKLALYILFSENETKSFLKKILMEAKRMGFDVLFTRVDAKQKGLLRLMLPNGATLSDILLTFIKKIDKKEPPQKESPVSTLNIIFEEARSADEEKLREITTSAYEHSHYFNDRNIPLEEAENVYLEWISNSVKGFADYVIVARLKDEIVGYITLRKKKLDDTKIGVIDLIAVDKNYRGQGIGKMLVIRGIEKIGDEIDNLCASTQVSNMPALRLYQSLGFKPVTSEVTFHIWLEATNQRPDY